MKVAMWTAFVFFNMMAVSTGMVAKKDRTITKVVKLLQDMLEKSSKEGDEERVLYAKFKCYCDTSEAEKKASIKEMTEQIELLESKIAEIQGDTGGLSAECADLKTSMADNKAARDEATAVRKKENAAFVEEEADLTEAIKDLKEAIEVLTTVGADQTASGGAADNKKFMAGFKDGSLLSLRSHIQTALTAANSLINSAQRAKITSFLQAPFTGTYTSQSAEIMGILKDMRDTFKTNLEDAQAKEKKALEAYNKFIEIKTEAFDKMKDSYEEKQKSLSSNDGDLASKKEQLRTSQKQKASDEEFLEKLLPLCKDKAEGYDRRKLMRANEEAAIAQAISILNSDAAFATFGTVDATSTGATKAALVQLHVVERHMSGSEQIRKTLQQVLLKAEQSSKSVKISKIVTLLQAGNPFEIVLKEIDKMIELIGEEAEADKDNLDWCNKERKENNAALKGKKDDILELEGRIDTLTKTIEDPKTGLKVQIEETELSLVQNKKAQTTETADRTEENVAYQKDVRNLVSAEALLKKALKVLKAYYDDLAKKLAAGNALVQEDPAAPEAWKGDGAYKGQSSKGNDVIDMLEFILSETTKEQMDAHKTEEKSQADYEDSMTTLKKEEAAAEKSLANLQETLAEKEKELLETQEELKATTKDKEELEAYLAKIKPGCDFITANFDLREKNRQTEKTALEKAVTLIKASPAYKSAVADATVESYGNCKEPCVKDAADVECKACMADVTIPAYCAGHKDTKGC